MLIVTIILGIIISLLIIEKQLTQKSVHSLELRIHVNGTRGKSSVTEYIAAGISNTESGVMAKITGIIPTIIYDGKEQFISRNGVARVQEQIKTIRMAARKKVKSLVLECMSISPELQRLESRIFKPHIYVITNIKDDHREAMGKSIEEQAIAICDAIPPDCIVITNETRFLDKIKEKVKANHSRVIKPGDIEPGLLNNLPAGVFAENVSIALSVCDAAGIDHKKALDGIMMKLQSMQTPLSTIILERKKIHFLNAFTVNDIESTETFINHWKKRIEFSGNISVIFNTRDDRPLRTDLFSKWIGESSSSISHIIVTGSHSGRAKQSMINARVDREKITIWKRRKIKKFKENLFDIVPDESLVVGVGNIAGDGFKIINGLK